MKANLYDLLNELTRIPAVSGAEQGVVTYLKCAFAESADEVQVDPMGNLTVTLKGFAQGPRAMLVAHADEVGGIVRTILPNGYLRFQILGFVSDSILPASRVLIGGEVPGVIGAQTAYLEDPADKDRVKTIAELFIDVGAHSEEEARRWGIREGDPLTFVGELFRMKDPDRVCGKAIDNRIGCALLIALFQLLAGKELPLSLHAVVTVQEETTMSGAQMAAITLRPDFAIVVDTVPSDDTPAVWPPDQPALILGKGPVIQLAEGVRPAYVGTLAHPGIKRLIIDTAETHHIPYQLSAMYGYWTTDAARIHPQAGGIPTGFISVPRRYAHSPVEVLDLNDAVYALQLLEALVLRADIRDYLHFISPEK
ncbi:MAG: M42 family peptidase [Chloroflexi bacterium]|nr:M42 family peptidase [Chloroflexota bacterium]